MAEEEGGPGCGGTPFWLPRDSERLWRGSYKGKDWRHLVRVCVCVEEGSWGLWLCANGFACVCVCLCVRVGSSCMSVYRYRRCVCVRLFICDFGWGR